MQAKYGGFVVAESNRTIEVEGNHYFPPADVHKEYFRESSYTTICPWKGTASYYDVEVEGKVGKNMAWYYPSPNEKAMHLKDHVAFWGDVKVEHSKG